MTFYRDLWAVFQLRLSSLLLVLRKATLAERKPEITAKNCKGLLHVPRLLVMTFNLLPGQATNILVSRLYVLFSIF